VAYVIDFQAGLFVIDPVNDAITPDAIGTVTVEFTGEFRTHLMLC
jgi:hypothetical protein